MEARIRKAGTDDVDAIAAFAHAVVPAHYEPILGAEGARAQLSWWTRERLGSAARAGRLHLAVHDDGPVGVCETGELDGVPVVWKLYLAPGARGRGLGARLLRAAVDALPHDATSVLVEHVAGNERAGRFYEREGFAVVRTEPVASGDPRSALVWRRKELSR